MVDRRVDLSIIIVNWNGAAVLPECLESIAKYPPSVPYEVIVVDNDSSDASREWLESGEAAKLFAEDRFCYIQSGENLGFGRANNLAMKRSKAEFFFLINSDAKLTEGAVDILLEVLKCDQTIGVAVPKLLNIDGSLQPSVWRDLAPPLLIIAHWLRLPKLFPQPIRGRIFLGSYFDHSVPMDISVAWGTAWMMRSRIFAEVGGFDEDFFMYAEDVEYSARIRKARWRIRFEPRAVVYHHNRASSLRKWDESERHRNQLKSYLLLLEKSCGRLHLIINLLAWIAILSLELILRKIRNRDDMEVRINFREVLKSLKKQLARMLSSR